MIVLPPGEPTTINSLLSLVTMVGVMELSIRLPGSIAFACPPTRPNIFGTPGLMLKSSISLFSRKPAPATNTRWLSPLFRRKSDLSHMQACLLGCCCCVCFHTVCQLGQVCEGARAIHHQEDGAPLPGTRLKPCTKAYLKPGESFLCVQSRSCHHAVAGALAHTITSHNMDRDSAC